MLPLSEVRELVLERCAPRPAQELELGQAHGCVLADAVTVADDATASDGAAVLRAGTVLSAPLVGVLAALGRELASVHPRPRVGVVSTGDELVEPWRARGTESVRDTNRPMLLAAVAAAGGVPVDMGPVRHDADAVAAALRSAATRCDLILTSGRAGQDDQDVMDLVLHRLSDPVWVKAAIEPIPVLGLATIDGVPHVDLPGDPVSSLLCFELLVRPAIRRLAGRVDLDRPRVTARAGAALRRDPAGAVQYRPVHFDQADDGTLVVRPVRAEGFPPLVEAGTAEGLAVLAEGEGVADGALVEVVVLDLAGALAEVAERDR